MQANPNFDPRETVRSISILIQLLIMALLYPLLRRQALVTIFLFLVQIDKSLIEMYIGIPIGYPKTSPVFLLAIDRNSK